MVLYIDSYFSVEVLREKINLDEKVLVPTERGGKEWKNKEKEIIVFSELCYGVEERPVIQNNIFQLIDFIELLKAFSSNKLQQKKDYRINENIVGRIGMKNGFVTLRLDFLHYDPIRFEKYECSALAAKLSKILSKCEPWRG